ncbi:tetratricopeptide repeat protein [Nocardia salmonicida]|uniref:tetratricopeptide repeat protein n=1 Tax=Nocardia salmonicida TaxID=53431 RepID=UPI003642DF96
MSRFDQLHNKTQVSREPPRSLRLMNAHVREQFSDIHTFTSRSESSRVVQRRATMNPSTEGRETLFGRLDGFRMAASKIPGTPLSLDKIADGTGVKVQTLKGWFPADPATPRKVPRNNTQLITVAEFLWNKTHGRAFPSRFDARTREDWESLRANASQHREPVDTALPSATTAEAIIVGAVPDRPEHFITREQFDLLINAFDGECGAITVVLTGMRGAGKTQLAGAYARHVLDTEGGLVGWINAETPDSVIIGLADIAERLNLAPGENEPAKSAHRLRDHLNTAAASHLLVLDNATDADHLRTVLPTRGLTRMVMTTTNHAITRLADVHIDAKSGYTPNQARSYLRQATGIVNDPDGEKQLAIELGDHPLALAAAAAAITATRPRPTYRDYLNKLASQPLPRALRRRSGSVYPLQVDKAILLNIDTAEAPTDDPELDRVVIWLLGLFAVLPPSGIRRSDLRHPDPTLNELVDEAIEHCTQHSMLNWSAREDRLFAHRLTARVLLERARAANTGTEVLTNIADVLAPHFIASHEQHWPRRADGLELVAQIEAVWASGLSTQANTELVERLLSLRNWAVDHLRRTASTAAALDLGERSVTAHEQLLGSDHPMSLTARNTLGVCYRSAGRLREAIPLLETVIAAREYTIGLDHPGTMQGRDDLALAYRMAGRVDDAITAHQRNLADRERVLGPDHHDTLVSRNNLAFAYRAANRLDEAATLFENNVIDRARLLGPDHPKTLISRSNLALVYRSAGRFADAITLCSQNLADRERLLGDDHPDTATSRGNLALCYLLAGEVDSAIPMYERALADRERIYGHDHPKTLISRSGLAGAYLAADRTDEAIEMLENTLADRQRVLSVDHPDILTSRRLLAEAYEQVGRGHDALELHHQNAGDLTRIHGDDHPDTRSTRQAIARLAASNPRPRAR